ncbi:MAG TPA: thioesterase family protein [Acetobacteraceae bacterium]
MQLPRHQASVRPEWVDANGHMNLAYYIVVFDHATDVAFAALGIGSAYRDQTGCSSFVVETHTLYEREVMENERLEVTTRLLGVDAKRLHIFHEMFRLGAPERVAAHELMCLNIDMVTRRVAPFPPDLRDSLAVVVAAHAKAAVPNGAGRRITMSPRAIDSV